jgi:cell division septation protein DedD
MNPLCRIFCNLANREIKNSLYHMFRRNKLILCFLLIVIAVPAISNVKTNMFSGNDSVVNALSQDETILFNMINDMRRQNNMPSIPLSHDLCKVAHIHINDLIVSKPQEKGCSLHSWSAKGKWTECCNTKDDIGLQCMNSKPREITGYPGNGYELIYWEEENATPSDAAELWQQVDASADMILSRGKWKNYQWKAMGVGLTDGYAVLWLGDKADKINTTESIVPVKQQITSKESKAAKSHEDVLKSLPSETVKQPAEVSSSDKAKEMTGEKTAIKYYLIVGSVKSPEGAKSELKRIKAFGYPDAFILEGNGVYRIALISYNSKKEASHVLPPLRADFPDIWIYKK